MTTPSSASPATVDLKQLAEVVMAVGQHRADDVMQLLELLRLLEQLHLTLRENYFHPALPTTRHDLYTLLQNIEESGGWPYIPRMTLQELLNRVTDQDF